MPDPSIEAPYLYVFYFADDTFEVGFAGSIRDGLTSFKAKADPPAGNSRGPATRIHLEGRYARTRAALRREQLMQWTPRKIGLLISRSARRRTKLQEEINARGGWFLCGTDFPLNDKTEQELREHLNLLNYA